jgi:hypothetical protein
MTGPRAWRLMGALTMAAFIVVGGCTSAGASPTAVGPSASEAATASPTPSAVPSASPTLTPSPTGTATAAPSEPVESLPPFACTPTIAIPATTDRAQITDVRVGTHDGYDRVTFEFTAGIPQTLLEAVLPPFYADPSGLPLSVAGTAFLKLTMQGGTAVAPDGTATYTGPTRFTPGFPQLNQLVEGGDFEAVSSWVLGLNGGGCVRLLTLDAPSRLVIDIEH